MALAYPKGSEWRRWDLQVHTPFSALNNGFGAEFDRYAVELFRQAIARDIAVIGVTDYFSIEGYRQLRELVGDHARLDRLLGTVDAAKARCILLLPNVELRTSIVITRRDQPDSRVNLHVIFSDEFEPEILEENFFRNIKFTAIATAGGSDERWAVTHSNLSALGERLKRDHPAFRDKPDLYVGMMNAVIAHEEISEVLASQGSRFARRYLIVVPVDEDLASISWDGQAHHTRKLLYQKSHMFSSGSPATREFGLARRHTSIEAFKAEFGDLKPCIHGSDAHTYDTLFEPALRRYLWIKGDPTFEGLRQLLHEPDSRVFIGEEPAALARVREHSTKYMKGVSFTRSERAAPAVQWFSGSLPINPGLVAIIGNKGGGKSALADVIALLGDTTAWSHFSFLSDTRFLNPKGKLGSLFTARIDWASGRVVERALGDPVDEAQPETVKYLPQKYLEKICEELQETSETDFYRELMEVIYSHVGESERLGKNSLPLLLDYVTVERQAKIGLLLRDLAETNRAVTAVEEQLTDQYRSRLAAQLAQRRAELEAHVSSRPGEVIEPTRDPTAQEATVHAASRLTLLEGKLRELDVKLDGEKAVHALSALQVAAAKRLAARIDNFERQLQSFYADSAGDCDVLGLVHTDVVALSVARQPIVAAQDLATERGAAAGLALSAEVEGSLQWQRDVLARDIEAVRLALDEPTRIFEEYRQRLSVWEAQKAEIEGTEAIPGSVHGLESQLASLASAPARAEAANRARSELVGEIFDTKLALLEDYRRLYAPVQDFINRHPISLQQGALKFSASIALDGFSEEFLGMIHRGRKGSFRGEEEGGERLKAIVARADFADEEGVTSFLGNVQAHIDSNMSDAEPSPVRVADQLRPGISTEKLYDYLYGLEYLKPRFELRWQDKPLDQLSPGERGNLLLVFYLLIDKRDIPLIIDQPEENLDNHTVATMLVPAIKDAKQRRQIVIVTHNPNLAVVCDADQIVHARVDKTDGNRTVYTAGSIEEPKITQLIVDVLEGTKPAFDLRDSRYDVLERVRGA